jgi:hypothetical protein
MSLISHKCQQEIYLITIKASTCTCPTAISA